MSNDRLSVPVVLYHAISSVGANGALWTAGEHVYVVERGTFERQMAYLASHEYRSVTVDQLVGPPHALRASAPHLAITFDDGWSSDAAVALPIVERLGLRATFFLTAASIGQPNRLSSADVKRLVDAGMSVQSHGLTHRYLTDLSAEERAIELRRSREILEEHTGRAVSVLSVPGGRFSRKVLDAARNAGYKAVCTSAVGWYTADGRFAVIPRFAVRQSTSLEDFGRFLQGDAGYLRVLRRRQRGTAILKSLLGNRLYERLRDSFLAATTPGW